MKGYKANDGFNAMKEDFDFLQGSLQEGIKYRSKDMFGVGGFISGGIVTPNGVNPDNIDISAGIGYDANGERFFFSAQSDIVMPYLPGNNYVLVSYQNYDDTPKADPTFGTLQNTRTQERAIIAVKPTYAPGDLDTYGNPYVPIALVTKPSSLNIDQNIRVDILSLKFDSVDTSQIVNSAVTFAKLSSYLRPLIWVTDEPNIHYDKETETFRTQSAGTFMLPGGSTLNTVDGFPIARVPAVPNVMLLTPSVIPDHWDVSVVSVAGFNPTTLLKTQILLGYLNEHDQFINLQASTPDEIIHMSEDEAETTRVSMHENMWRRRNEAFQSFTSITRDGTPLVDSHLVYQSGTDYVVSPGVSHVAGRRISTTAPETIGASNTENYPVPFAGDYGLWVQRESSVGKRFRLDQGTVANAYLLATVTYDIASQAIATPVDRRKFTPVAEIEFLETATRNVLLGCSLSWKSNTEVIVGPGEVGFPDGQVRKNTTSKVINFTDTALDILSADVSGGRMAEGSMTPYRWFCVFATASHAGNEFNLVASRIPYFEGVSGASGTYTGAGFTGFVNGQRVRLYKTNASGQNIVTTSENDFSGVTTAGVEGETIVAWNAGGISTTGISPVGSLSSGTVVALNKFSPNLAGVTNYRLIGFVGTDASGYIKKFTQVSPGKMLITSADTSAAGVTSMYPLRLDWGVASEYVPFLGKTVYGGGQGPNSYGPCAKDIVKYAPSCADSLSLRLVHYWKDDSSTNPTNDPHGNYAFAGRRIAEITGAPQHIVGGFQLQPWGGLDEISGRGSGGVAIFDCPAFQGTVAIETTSYGYTNMSSLHLTITGFEFDLKKEWSLQTAGGGFLP